jgi:CO dehydrogenase flavoprotein C-terminal domain
MKRVHLFEIEDQLWVPTVFRNMLTDFLTHLNMIFGFYEVAMPLIDKVLAHIKSKQIIDLCSGASGPWVKLTKDEKTIFLKFRLRNAIDFAIVSVASAITVAEGLCRGARLVLGAVAPVPTGAGGVEEFLKGKELTEEAAQRRRAGG